MKSSRISLRTRPQGPPSCPSKHSVGRILRFAGRTFLSIKRMKEADDRRGLSRLRFLPLEPWHCLASLVASSEIHMVIWTYLNHDTLRCWTITMDHGLLTSFCQPWYPVFHPKIAGKMAGDDWSFQETCSGENVSIAIKSQGKIPMTVNHSVLKRDNIQSIQYGCHRDYSYLYNAKKKVKKQCQKASEKGNDG